MTLKQKSRLLRPSLPCCNPAPRRSAWCSKGSSTGEHALLPQQVKQARHGLIKARGIVQQVHAVISDAQLLTARQTLLNVLKRFPATGKQTLA
ncbi:hypothetical protein D3C84_1126310 [compost metagenome]